MTLLINAISEAAELKLALDKLQGQDANLSARGAILEAQRLGGKDDEADLAISEIESGSADGKHLKSTFTRLAACVRNFARTSVLKPERMGSFLGDGGEAMTRLRISRPSMMLAVIRVLAATEKGLFGTQDSPTSHATALAKLKTKLEAAYGKIEASITLADLTVHQDITAQDRESGLSRITFRLTGDLIAVADGRDLPERLVGWWLANNGRKKVAA